MSWLPNASVTINGTNYNSKALWSLNVTYGRSSIWQQPRAGYATFSLLNADGTDYAILPNQQVTITIQNSSGVNKTIFTGRVSSIVNKLVKNGSVKTIAVQTITAYSVFAAMSRKSIGSSSYPKELDSDRMSRIFTEAGVSVDVVDSPGTYTFDVRAASPTDAYSIAANYATQSFGYIYETTDGKVGYANEAHRLVDARDNGYTAIPTNVIDWHNIQSEKSNVEILNDVRVNYKTGSVTMSDINSQLTYGTLAAQFTTELDKAADASMQADRWIALRATPRTSLSAFTIHLDDDRLSSTLLDKLVTMRMGFPFSITGLPTAIKDTIYKGFVEGWTFSINRVQATISINSSDTAYSVAPTRWKDVQATLIWSGVTSTLQWANYDGV